MNKAAKKEAPQSKLSTAAEEYLKSKLRSDKEPVKSPTQKLIINISSVDADGNDISQHNGKFHILGTNLYSKTIRIRPINVQNKLIKMVKTKTKDGGERWSYVNETVFFSNYSDILYDSKGGFGCGKVFGQVRKELNKADAAANEDKAKSYLYVFGLIEFPEDKGNWHLVDFRTGGKRIVSITDALSFKNIGKNRIMSQFTFGMELKATKSAHPDLTVWAEDLDKLLPLDDIIQIDESIENFIKQSNERVMTFHKKYSNQLADMDTEETLDIGEEE